ncbi:MAG TPA: NADH-quinone oxidoreductase subunit J [bacterium]|jgi:NADH-quinone oxidoreductase subunit J|nr:NADH-quinone oxidoreductase subunit J [bacterium]
MGLNDILFAIFSFGALSSAIAVVLTRNTVHAALHFVGHLLCLAVLYCLLNAPLLGVLQVMVYAGAVMVLFVFAVMILDMGEQEHAPLFNSAGQALGAGILGALLLGLLAWGLGRGGLDQALAPAGAASLPGVETDNIAQVARSLFREGALTFEAVGILLLTAVVAVMVMAKRKLES